MVIQGTNVPADRRAAASVIVLSTLSSSMNRKGKFN
jgi:hypothetical protein